MVKTKQIAVNPPRAKRLFVPPKLPTLQEQAAQKEAAAVGEPAEEAGPSKVRCCVMLCLFAALFATNTLVCQATKTKGVQKGKVGKGKLTFAQRKKISKACTGKQKLTLADKFEIFRLHKTLKWTSTAVAEKFNVHPRSIRKICEEANYSKMKAASNAGINVDVMKTMRPEDYPELTAKLLEWITTVREKFTTDKVSKLLCCVVDHCVYCKLMQQFSRFSQDFGFGTSLEMIKTKGKEFARAVRL